ncbi:MAG: hypothetical protein MJ209_01500 [archaeon]|nr:hypothetical protein [archaeon]
MDYGQGEDIWAIYKIDNVGQNDVPIDFYAINLDTNETTYLGTNNTLSAGEVYLKDLSILNTLKPTPSNYLILTMTQDNMTVGNGSLIINPMMLT